MPHISSTQDPTGTKQALDRAVAELGLEESRSRREQEPVVPPEPEEFTLAGGYLAPDDRWHTTFVVRELTGRDEERLTRIDHSGKFVIELIRRGLVSVGTEKATDEVIDGLLSGDWDTVLLAIRAVTFGRMVRFTQKCDRCSHEYEGEMDITTIDNHTVGRDDLVFEVQGAHHIYTVSLPFGSARRKVMNDPNITGSEVRSLLLRECVLEIDGKPVRLPEEVLDLSWNDRRLISEEIDRRMVGPKLREVTTKCPSCDAEQSLMLSIAALFLT